MTGKDLVARPRVLAPATDVDSWTAVAADVARLAQSIAATEFVPVEMRGKPAVVTAAILAGRELGIGPMTSLQHIHLVKGRPGQSAHLMRALVLAAGHDIDYVEVTDARAVIRGRRTGEDEWTTVAFTAEQARRARIQLGDYPADKLVARATARLCRRKFADVISGLAYATEELDDTGAEGDPGPVADSGRRRTTRRPAAAAAGVDREAAEMKPPGSAPGAPPLPGDTDSSGDEPAGQGGGPGVSEGRAAAAATRSRSRQGPPPPTSGSNPGHSPVSGVDTDGDPT